MNEIETLCNALHDSAAAVRESAAESLGILGAAPAVEPLMDLLDHDADADVRAIAALSAHLALLTDETTAVSAALDQLQGAKA
ncbi:MAG: HEAT repeat domain-containing protein [Chloroflexota bacterium]|nr:HEAT repeat domain-containing protein [Chloroflexota bacterium]